MASNIDALEVRIAALNLRPGQVLVLQSDSLVYAMCSGVAGAASCLDHLAQIFPDNKVLILGDDVRLTVVAAKDTPRVAGPHEPIIKLTG